MDELLKKGAIELSRSCFNSPIFLVPKASGRGMRAVLDFWRVSSASAPDRYTIREGRDCVDEIWVAWSQASFARLTDYCMREIRGVLTYIDDVLDHCPDHPSQLKTLETAFFCV